MPFTSQGTQFFGDGADVGTSTQVGTAELLVTGELVIKPVSGLGADTLTLTDPAKVKAKLASMDARIDADPNDGHSEDLADDPAVAVDPEQATYKEGATPIVEVKSSSTKQHDYAPATLKGLLLALTALGL